MLFHVLHMAIQINVVSRSNISVSSGGTMSQVAFRQLRFTDFIITAR